MVGSLFLSVVAIRLGPKRARLNRQLERKRKQLAGLAKVVKPSNKTLQKHSLPNLQEVIVERQGYLKQRSENKQAKQRRLLSKLK